MKTYDLVIIGAGAAGLMCAITAAKRGRTVIVLERSNKVGKKILMSGGGRCNFTNRHVEAENFLSHNPHFCKSALTQYTQWDFIALVEQYDIAYHEKKLGQLFCDHSAKDILNMLLKECEQYGVHIETQHQISEVKRIENGNFRYQLNSDIATFSCESLVVASGALSIPTLGGSGFGYELAQQFNLPLYERTAGLVPFTFSDHLKTFCTKLSGVSLDVEMSSGSTSFRESILFTHRGMSGPVALQVSNYWKPGETLSINLCPDIDLYEWLLQQKADASKSLLRTVLGQLFSKALVLELQSTFWLSNADTPLAEMADKKLEALAHQLQNWTVKPAGTEGYRTAEVTLGGVDTDALSSKTMECKTQPGLFFVGEVMDVTGHLGGFNFQWAWSSGFCAGMNA